MKLRELQKHFFERLEGENSKIDLHIKNFNHLDATKRLNIYTGSAKGNLIEALRGCYPVVEKLIGKGCFDEVAYRYVKKYTHHSPDISDYGQDYSYFLSQCEPLKSLRYLSDLAALEWAVHKAKDATSQERIDPKVLNNIPENRQLELKFGLPPQSTLIASRFPIKKIWETNQVNFKGDICINLDVSAGDKVFVYFKNYLVEIVSINELTFLMLELFDNQTPFGVALELLQNRFPTENIPQIFAFALHRGWLSSMSF